MKTVPSVGAYMFVICRAGPINAHDLAEAETTDEVVRKVNQINRENTLLGVPPYSIWIEAPDGEFLPLDLFIKKHFPVSI